MHGILPMYAVRACMACASRALAVRTVCAWCAHGVRMCIHMPGECDGGSGEVEVDHQRSVEAARGVARVQRCDLGRQLHLAVG